MTAAPAAEGPRTQQSVSVGGARKLAITTRTRAQIRTVTPRWLLHVLPWVSVQAGTYRVNRRKVLVPEDVGVPVLRAEGRATVNAAGLRRVRSLRKLDDAVLQAIAGRLSARTLNRGEEVLQEGQTGGDLIIVADGLLEVTKTGPHGETLREAVLGEGDYYDNTPLPGGRRSGGTVRALTAAEILLLDRGQFEALLNESPPLRALLEGNGPARANGQAPTNEYGEMDFATVTSRGDAEHLPGSYVDYDEAPREYPLTAVQAVVQIRTTIADLYNDPYDQLREQMRHAIETVKEQEEWELINNKDFGLLHNVARPMRVPAWQAGPTPDMMDELLSRVWKKPAFFLAHPRAIAAFGRECTARGVPPPTVQMFGSPFVTWRGVPLVPSDKLMVNGESRAQGGGTTNILLLRVGEKEQGVVGLHQPGIPHEHLPSLSVRFMGIDRNAIASYPVSQYVSAAVLTDDALGVLENVEVGYYHDKQ
jgi:hypothetical protein